MAIKDFAGFRARRSQRMANQGIVLEDTVEKLLEKLKDEKKILGFTRHPHNSKEDSSGKDFTVIFDSNGYEDERSFGVTISLRSWHDAKLMHRDVPQFCWPIGTNTTTMQERILKL